MTLTSPMFLFFLLITYPYITKGQERSPHGLAYQNPVAFSPSAYEFFHPKTQDLCANSGCSPFPLAAHVESTRAHESKVDSENYTSHDRVGAAALASVVFGFVFVLLLAMGVYYVVNTRQENMRRINSVKPDAVV